MFQAANPLRFQAQNPNADGHVPNLTEAEIRLKQTNRITSLIIYFCISILLLILLIAIGLTVYGKINSHSDMSLNQCHQLYPGNTFDQRFERTVTEEYHYIEPKISPSVKSSAELIEKVVKIETHEHNVEPHTGDIYNSGIQRIREDLIPRDLNNCEECLNYGKLRHLADNSVDRAENYIKETVSRALHVDLGAEDDEKLGVMEDFASRMTTIPHLRQKIDELLSLNRTFGQVLSEAESKTLLYT